MTLRKMAGLTKYQKLEIEYANFAGTKYAVSVNSGTSALHVALLAYGIGRGDEVIVPDFTMAACGFAVSYTGAKVVTVDCGEDFNIDPNKIEEKITKKTKAIMPVHIYGRLCDIDRIREIAEKYNLVVIEDGCEVQGATKGCVDAICFSFYKNKIVHAEEGGMVCTDDEDIANRINYLKNMAFGDKHDYFHNDIGYNYRMPESQAEMVLESLKNYPHNAKQRRIAEEKFYEEQVHDAVWVLDTLCDTEKERDFIMDYDKTGKLRHFFKPLSTMPMWKQDVGKNALDFSKRGMYTIIDKDTFNLL